MNATSLAGACSVWKAGHTYTLPKPSKNARLFVLCLRVMYMIVLEAAKHVTVTYNLGNLADWVSAVGTVSAVIVALFFNYYGILKSNVSELKQEVKEYIDSDREQNRRLIFVNNLTECLEFIADDQNTLYSKKNYLKAIIPTLKEIEIDLLEDPLTQYKITKVIHNIEQENDFDKTSISKLTKELVQILKTYNKSVNEKQKLNEEELSNLIEELKSFSK